MQTDQPTTDGSIDALETFATPPTHPGDTAVAGTITTDSEPLRWTWYVDTTERELVRVAWENTNDPRDHGTKIPATVDDEIATAVIDAATED